MKLLLFNLADHLGISFSGAKSRVQRAREKLRQLLLDCCHFEFDRPRAHNRLSAALRLL